MSFRARLTLFFVLIVIVPMIAVAFVLFRLEVSTLAADDYVLRVRRFTNLDAVIARRGRLVTATKPGTGSARLPDDGEVHLAGRRYRVASFPAPDFGGRPARVSVLLDAHD